jgi:hypothetical protein
VNPTSRINAIEKVCQAEAERDVRRLAEFSAGGLAAAAQSIAATRHASVAVLTGTYIPWATPPAAETDGPPGAVLLAAALDELGVPARLVTDHWCLPVLAAALAETGRPLAIDICDADGSDAGAVASMYRRQGITHLVSIERLGPAADGAIRNFRGEDVTAFNADVEALVGVGLPWSTIGIGDGGNEIGMGNAPASLVAGVVDHGERIHCRVRCDHLVIAGVSNWGALGLLLGVALLAGGAGDSAARFAGADWHRRVVGACVSAGAVDGTVGRSLASVDGLRMSEHDAVIDSMWSAGEIRKGAA